MATGQPRPISAMALIFCALHIALCAFVYGTPATNAAGFKRAGLYRVIFEVLLLSFFAIGSVFAHPDRQSAYLPFPIVLLVVLFTYQARFALWMIVGYVGGFSVLSCLFKPPALAGYDLHIAFGTLLAAFTCFVITANLRHETGGAIVRLKYLSMTDGMTGLYNKQTFQSLCEAYMRDESNDKGYALLFFDVDHFKLINDQHGHPFGDTVLTGVADVMRSAFYEKDYLCRFGGDEFVVFMVDIEREADVMERVRSFRARVRALGKSIDLPELTCSVGVALKAKQRETYAELLSRADAALYVAKDTGRPQAMYVEQSGQPATSASVIQSGEKEPLRRVLIVDDNAVNRRVLRKILSRTYYVIEAENGKEALDVLRRERGGVSAVLLDIVMPVMDGSEVLAVMRADETLRDIPVIVTTGYGEDEDEVRALSLGANDFVVKPYRPAVIMHRLKNTIHLRETSALLGTRRPEE